MRSSSRDFLSVNTASDCKGEPAPELDIFYNTEMYTFT